MSKHARAHDIICLARKKQTKHSCMVPHLNCPVPVPDLKNLLICANSAYQRAVLKAYPGGGDPSAMSSAVGSEHGGLRARCMADVHAAARISSTGSRYALGKKASQ